MFLFTRNRGLQQNVLVESHRSLSYFQGLHKHHEKGGIYDYEQVYPKTAQFERIVRNQLPFQNQG